MINSYCGCGAVRQISKTRIHFQNEDTTTGRTAAKYIRKTAETVERHRSRMRFVSASFTVAVVRPRVFGWLPKKKKKLNRFTWKKRKKIAHRAHPVLTGRLSKAASTPYNELSRRHMCDATCSASFVAVQTGPRTFTKRAVHQTNFNDRTQPNTTTIRRNSVGKDQKRYSEHGTKRSGTYLPSLAFVAVPYCSVGTTRLYTVQGDRVVSESAGDRATRQLPNGFYRNVHRRRIWRPDQRGCVCI